ncbi:MAG TPA: hypothetical protein DC054_02395 [Blastocatellia bacterium]|nr:hypothetical protein [Blastocatellia bacterium]
MNVRHLLRSQTNELFELVQQNGFQPSEFEWQETVGMGSKKLVSQLVHKTSGFYFCFDNYSGFSSFWSPSYEVLHGAANTKRWKTQTDQFSIWLSYLKRETESPDLWKTISQEAQVLESAADADTSNAAFNSTERAYIVQGINEIKQFLLTAHKVDPELVEARLNYLIESSERVGRKDWINLLVSVLVGIVISAALPPETTRELFRFAGTVLRQIINQPLLLM